MSAAKAAFARHYKAERDRSEKALEDILELLITPGRTAEEAIEAALDRLEAHYGRYDQPDQSLAPIKANLVGLGSKQ